MARAAHRRRALQQVAATKPWFAGARGARGQGGRAGHAGHRAGLGAQVAAPQRAPCPEPPARRTPALPRQPAAPLPCPAPPPLVPAEVKMRELGVSTHPDYKLAFM